MTGMLYSRGQRLAARGQRLAAHAWFRAAADLLLVGVAAVDAMPGLTAGWNKAFVSSVVALTALLLRRRWPLLTWLLGMPEVVWGNALVGPMIALFTVADRMRRVWVVGLAAAASLVANFVSSLVYGAGGPLMAVGTLQLLIYAGLFAGLPTALGLLLRARRQLGAQLESLVASQAREQQLIAEAVLAAERTRLAREMHDVVSHQVSLIALQSGALRMAAADDEARQTAATIRSLAVKTLEELRSMVGVLRSRPEGPQLAPQPGLAELRPLVEDSATGAELVLAGVAARPWPPRVERAVYRTVQEGLTNVRKHASGAAVRVEVSARGATLIVRVRNGAPPGARPADTHGGFPASGHGLIGLRERAALLGGELTASPAADGGFKLRATFNAEDPAAGVDSRDQDWTQIAR